MLIISFCYFIEHKLFRTADADGNIAFAKLKNYLAMNFPHEKLPYLKCLLLGEIVIYIIYDAYYKVLF